MNDYRHEKYGFEICVVVPRRNGKKGNRNFDCIEVLVKELKNVGFLVDRALGLTAEFIKLAASPHTLGKAAADLQMKKLTYIGMDLQFEWEEAEAFVRQPDGSLFSWIERFKCYHHLLYGIVVTVAKFQGGGAFNVIPDSVTIGGTFRAFSKESFMQLRQRINEVITGQASVQRCTAIIDFLERDKPFFPPTINNNELHEYFRTVAVDMLGKDKVKDMQPLMGSEDFAVYQEAVPGYFFFIGMKNETHKHFPFAHSPLFEVNEDTLPYGAALHASLAARYLLEFQSQVPLPGDLHHDEL